MDSAIDHEIQSSPQTSPGPMTGEVTSLAVTGMTCTNCARHVTEALQGVAGVRSAVVSLDEQQATVRWQANAERNKAALIKAVEAEGYGAKVVEAAEHANEHGEHRLAGWQRALWVSVLGTLPLMLGEWALNLGQTRWFQWLSFALAGVVQVFAGARFYRGAWNQLRVGSSNMDTLVALGSTTAFAYSTWALLSGQGGHLYFMEAAAIIALIGVGHWMESRVSVRASSALRQLLHLSPALARRLNADGTTSEVPVSELQPGHQVRLKPGDRVPTDGAVLEGSSALEESMLTGEPAPVDKSVGDLLYAGTVNLSGTLLMRVTATGEETALAHIIAAVQRAQTSRANVQRLADRVSNVFVPVVVVVALAAALWWGLAPESARSAHAWFAQFLWMAHPPEGAAAAFIIAAAILIIACPCAMGLATPVAIMAGSNSAAQRGILIRDGVALEKAGNITAVLFDKTGTLTIGKPVVVKVWEPDQSGAEDHGRAESTKSATLGLATALARHSLHPLSQAIASLAPNGPAADDWKETRGAGIEGKVRMPGPEPENHQTETVARLGSLRWLGELGVDLEPAKRFVEEWSTQGATIVGLANGRALAALFAVKDTLKSGAHDVLDQLHKQGLKSFLVTGDNPRTAASIARLAGIAPDRVFAEVRPEEKSQLVRKLQEQGEHVAFVGDGINDAPALEQADLGIAVSKASDIAREAADIILLKSEIGAVPESLGLARATLRTIRQNLFWAFFYNAASIPLAALGFMSPILCAAAMGLSDLVVIGNALRLRRWRL